MVLQWIESVVQLILGGLGTNTNLCSTDIFMLKYNIALCSILLGKIETLQRGRPQRCLCLGKTPSFPNLVRWIDENTKPSWLWKTNLTWVKSRKSTKLLSSFKCMEYTEDDLTFCLLAAFSRAIKVKGERATTLSICYLLIIY